jgi:protein-L-isoaspartate(D-aspartate) O-methyltransferase
MDHAALYANARNLMVDGQVRPNRVYDSRVLDAMRRLPREQFVPPAQAARAYADQDVPLGGGRVLTEPMVIARLLQLADIRRGERALVVAAGSGYSAALVAACEAQVTALEEDAGLLAMARALLPVWAPGVTVVEGPLAAGWPGGAPYDVILIDGAVEQVPEAIVRQLRPASMQAGTPQVGAPGGGRLVTVQRRDGIGQGVVGEAVAGALRFAAGFDCATTKLPAFRHAAGFVF